MSDPVNNSHAPSAGAGPGNESGTSAPGATPGPAGGERPTGQAVAPLAGLFIDRSAAPAGRRRGRWLKWVLVLAIVAIAAALWFAPRAVEVQVGSVQAAYPSQQYALLTASGYVVAQRRASVASKATGRLVELRVREGSLLKRGELIGRIDPSDVDASLKLAEAAIAQSDAAIAQAQATAAQARAEAVNAEAELRRQQQLSARGFVSPQAVDAAERRALTARAAVAAADAGIASARAGLEQARAQVAVQRVNRDNTEIRAPFDGVVLVKNANVGDMITPFSAAAGTLGAVVTMADLGTLEVEADVSESNVARVKPEQPVEITLDALPEVRFRGRVARIVPTVDRAKATVMTKIRFDALDPRILPEMSAKAHFLSQEATDADQKPVVAVSPRAIAQRDGKTVVFRLRDDRVEAVPVTPGRKLGELQEITGQAVSPGQRIVLQPSEKLREGGRVTIAGK